MVYHDRAGRGQPDGAGQGRGVPGQRPAGRPRRPQPYQ